MPQAKATSFPWGKLPRAWRDRLSLIPRYDPGRDSDGFIFDTTEAEKRLRFFSERLRHTKGDTGPFVLQPWQEAIVANLFGWKDAAGLRRYREMFLYIARKNGKTALCAGILLCCLAMDDEPGAELYSAAGDLDQARRLRDYAFGAVKADPAMRQRFRLYEASDTILYESPGSSYRAISSVADTKLGFNAHVVVLDELWVQPDRRLLDALITSQSARRQPLFVSVTTADYLRDSPCNQKYDYAHRVREGLVKDARFLPVLYEVSQEKLAADEHHWRTREAWQEANPGLGTIKSTSYMERECLRALAEPSYQAAFQRYELNIRTGQESRWIDPADWAACRGAVDPIALAGRPCHAGLDLSSVSDLSSLALLFYEDGNKVLSFSWTTAAEVQRRRERGEEGYRLWHQDGHLRVCDGKQIDHRQVVQEILELARIYKVQTLQADPHNALQALMELKEGGLNVVAHNQGTVSMNDPCKTLERWVLSREITHDGNPVLAWAVENCAVRRDRQGNIAPDKGGTTDGKIDPLVALVMAIGGAITTEKKPDYGDTPPFDFWGHGPSYRDLRERERIAALPEEERRRGFFRKKYA
jgi:phage terminase large subunit-like protein